MGTFGTEFVNVATDLDAFPPFLDARFTWGNFTGALVTKLTELRDRRAGGYVYFPPGAYFPTGEFSIPSNVTAIFAPGAVLTMPLFDRSTGRNFAQLSIHIQGSIQAGLHKIVDGTFVNGLPARGGFIFETDTVKEVYPEWWGAIPIDGRNPQGLGTPPPPDSADAIQAAFDAAINDVRRSGGTTGTSIPVVLTGAYFISRPVLIGERGWRQPSSVSESSPFVLRGRTGPNVQKSGFASLQAHPNFPRSRGLNLPESLSSEHHLLVVKGPPGFLIENLQLDASDNNKVQRAFGCLHIEKGAAPADAQMSRVRRCALRMGLVNLVQIGEFDHPYLPRLPGPAQGGQDLLGLVFEACKFEQDIRPPEGAALADWTLRASSQAWLRDGVYYRALNSLRLHFIDCFWRGMMRAGIRTYSGSVTITNCNFHLSRMPVPDAVALQQDARYSTMFRADASEAELLMWARRFSGDKSNLTQPGSTEMPQDGLDQTFVDARDNGCDIYVEHLRPASPFSTGIQAIGVESQSWRFLATFPRTELTDMERGLPSLDVYLEDVHAVQSVTGLTAPLAPEDAALHRLLLLPPAIEWLGPFSYGACLSVSGVHLMAAPTRRGLAESNGVRSNYYYTHWSGRIVLGVRGLDARVTDLGARTGAGFPSTSTPASQVFFSIGSILMTGPAPISRARQPWYLNLQVPPVLVPG